MNDKQEGSGWDVVKNTQARIRHTMLRVKNLNLATYSTTSPKNTMALQSA